MERQLHVGHYPLNMVHITKKLTNGTDKILNPCGIGKLWYQAVYHPVPKSQKQLSVLAYQWMIDLINDLGEYQRKIVIWVG